VTGLDFKAALEGVLTGKDLPGADAEVLFGAMLDGQLDASQAAGLLIALRAKGESPSEISGAARALLARVAPFPRPAGDVLDVCGTGGDGARTLNVSTAVAFVAAAAGVRVAKHGNRAISSACGSADVLAALGVPIDDSATVSARRLEELGVCFLLAPAYHPGLARIMPIRRALGVRTAFNLLGPLVNPARPTHQLLGVYAPALVPTVARALGELGVCRALVVHGAGTDEIALHGPTCAAWLEAGALRELELVPEDAGIARAPLEALAGGAPGDNARRLLAILAGREDGPARDAVALNAGAALWVMGVAGSLREGTRRALDLLASGAPARVLARWAGRADGAP